VTLFLTLDGAMLSCAAQHWQELLNVPAKDTRTGHDRSSAILAMIIAQEQVYLEAIYKVSQSFFRTQCIYGRQSAKGATLQAGAKPTVMDEHGRTPLMEALVHGNDDAVKQLVQLGADLNAYDEEVYACPPCLFSSSPESVTSCILVNIYSVFFKGTTILKFAFVSPRTNDLLTKLEDVKNPGPGSDPGISAGKTNVCLL